jgi:hypothetical protein
VLAADAAEAVAAGAHRTALEEHLDVVPVVEARRQSGGPVTGSAARRLSSVWSDSTTPQPKVSNGGCARPTTTVGRVLLLHQQREIQAGGATANAQDVHEEIV